MALEQDHISDFLSKAKINFTTPVTSFLLLSRDSQSLSSSSPSNDFNSIKKEKAYVIDHKNITDIVETSKKIITTVETCSGLCNTIDSGSSLKLLRLQTDSSHSLIITGKCNYNVFFFF